MKKRLAAIVAILGLLAMTTPAFAGGTAIALSDQQLDSIVGAGIEDENGICGSSCLSVETLNVDFNNYVGPRFYNNNAVNLINLHNSSLNNQLNINVFSNSFGVVNQGNFSGLLP